MTKRHELSTEEIERVAEIGRTVSHAWCNLFTDLQALEVYHREDLYIARPYQLLKAAKAVERDLWQLHKMFKDYLSDEEE